MTRRGQVRYDLMACESTKSYIPLRNINGSVLTRSCHLTTYEPVLELIRAQSLVYSKSTARPHCYRDRRGNPVWLRDLDWGVRGVIQMELDDC